MKDIPVTKVIELSKNYTSRQIELILKDEVCNGVPPNEVITIYERATKLEDEFVLNLICTNYNLALFYQNAFGLPESTLEEANAAFDEIYEFIHKIAKPQDIEKMKRRYRVRKNNNCTRKYGGKTYAKCFTKSSNKVIFHIRTYLYRCDGETVRKIATLLDCPSDIKHGLIPTLIDWILKQPKVKSVTLAVLKTIPDKKPMPLEDVIEIEQGIIEMRI